jgi:DNA-binding CsgD family transcriptional regulator
MTKLFQALIQNLSTSKDEVETRFCFMDGAGELFQCQHWGISLFDETAKLQSVDLKGLPDSFIDYYQSYGIQLDPLRKYVDEHHAPVHEQMLFTEAGWKESDLYVHGCGLQYDHEHAMSGPIVGQGTLVGMVHFARIRNNQAFNSKDIAHLSGVCAHLSATLANLQFQTQRSVRLAQNLTPREIQIAELVARGLTNEEIGVELWITRNTVKQTLKRMFQKLNVVSRVELVMKLYDLK